MKALAAIVMAIPSIAMLAGHSVPVQAQDTNPVVLSSAATAANQWIMNNFSSLPTYTGGIGGLDPTENSWKINADVFVKDAQAKGGYYGLRINPGGDRAAKAALMNVTISDQGVDGKYAAGLFTDRTWYHEDGPDQPFDVFFSNVTITPNLPHWESYNTTNFDGITFDGGRGTGHVYAQGLTINGWADAAIDVKSLQIQVVDLHTEGDGNNTIKLWYPGPHYIVNSTINNSRWKDHNVLGSDGGLVWTWDCSKLELKIFNSLFNGDNKLPRSKISCEVGDRSQVKITYLAGDPRKTGEMHPMFKP